MNNPLLELNLSNEADAIILFLKDVFRKTGKKRVVIGWSGGIDSTVSLFLLARVLSPQDIRVIHMPYSSSFIGEFGQIRELLKLPQENISEHFITNIVDLISKEEKLGKSDLDKVRLGNIMARIRMVILFDQARAIDGLVCGTENKSEHLLGYFTRYGDGASDIEPIIGLYKTQVYALAQFLGVPEVFIKKAPSAGLWTGQTDEGEFGFSYEEADMVCHLYFDLKEPVETIVNRGFVNAAKIIDFTRKNSFKLTVPYTKS